jgi:hypothetical protein
VLDRANTLEFSAVDFGGFLGNGIGAERTEPLVLDPDMLAKLQLGALDLPSQAEAQDLRDDLAPLLELNALLTPLNRHFGYRVLNEVAHFLRAAHSLVSRSPEVTDAAIDAQVLQKVLPKIAGSEDDHEGVLTAILLLLATGRTPPAPPVGERWSFPELADCFMLDPPDIANVDTRRLRAAIERRARLEAVGDGQPGGGAAEPAFEPARYPRSAAWMVTMLARMAARA